MKAGHLNQNLGLLEQLKHNFQNTSDPLNKYIYNLKSKTLLYKKAIWYFLTQTGVYFPLVYFMKVEWSETKQIRKNFHCRTKLAFTHPALVLDCLHTQNMLDQLNMTSWPYDKTVSFPPD